MNTYRLPLGLALAAFGFVLTASAQSVTSAHSGTVHYFEGSVSIDGVPVEAKVSKFSEIKENSVFRTAQGRAEILLTPGVFLRLGENTEIKMLDNRLLSTRVEFISGTAMIESDDPTVSVKDTAVSIVYKSYEVQPLKYGVFEMTSDPAQMKVFKGQAVVLSGTSRVVVKDGHLLPFSAALLTEKFDEKTADDLLLWTRDRSAYVSAANMSSARTLANGSGYTGMGSSGGWYLNPFMNMYTYMPYAGYGYNPFGYGFYSPSAIGSFYYPGNYYWYGGGGARTGNFVGQPLTSSGITRVANSTVPRLTSGTSVHPTLSSPISGSSGNVAAIRSGFGEGMVSRGGFNSGVANSSSASSASSGGGGFSGASLGGGGGGGGFSGGGAARSSGGGGGAAARGR